MYIYIHIYAIKLFDWQPGTFANNVLSTVTMEAVDKNDRLLAESEMHRQFHRLDIHNRATVFPINFAAWVDCFVLSWSSVQVYPYETFALVVVSWCFVSTEAILWFPSLRQEIKDVRKIYNVQNIGKNTQ